MLKINCRVSVSEKCIPHFEPWLAVASVLTATLPTLTPDAVPPRVVMVWIVMFVKRDDQR